MSNSTLLTDKIELFVRTLGELSPYQETLVALAYDLAASLRTAMAAAPVAKQLQEVLAQLNEASPPVEGSKLDQLLEKA